MSRLLLLQGLLVTVLLGACAPSEPLNPSRLAALEGLIQEVDEGALMRGVSDLVLAHRSEQPLDCELLGTNSKIYPELCNLTHRMAGDLLQARLEQLGMQVRRQQIPKEVLTVTNIVAELPGVSRPEEVILITAHYDAYYAAADDNSTGVAALLELARVLSRYRFERTLRFVGFDLEELGYVGSSRYVNALDASSEIMLAVNFDSLGYYDSTPGSQKVSVGLPAPDRADFLAVLGNDNSASRVTEFTALNESLQLMKVFGVVASGLGNNAGNAPLLRSDHSPFWLSGRQAVFITDTAYFRNPGYHNPGDTIDVLNPAMYRRAVQLSAAAIAYWAGGPL